MTYEASSSASSDAVYVSSSAGLLKALKSMPDGGEIILKSGDYGFLDLNRAKHGLPTYKGEVTIRSEDPDAPASFSGMLLKNMSNMTFDGVVVDYDAASGAAIWTRAVLIEDGAGMTFRNVVFDGDLATGLNAVEDGHGTGIAMVATRVDGLTIEDSVFTQWNRAVVIGGGQDFVIRGNDISDIRSDGLNFGAVANVLIEGNHIHDFNVAKGSADHPDMIQFMNTSGSTRSENIVIRGNILDSGVGNATQSIFIRNEAVDRGHGGSEIFYRDIVIEDNLIRNAHAHGITVGQTHGLTIANNTVLHNASTASGESFHVPKIAVSAQSTGVEIVRNVAHSVGGGPEAWTVADNLTIQRTAPGRADHYDALFVDAMSDPEEISALQALPDSAITRDGLGAAMTRFDGAPEALTALMRVALDPSQDHAVLFDGRLSTGPDGFVTSGAVAPAQAAPAPVPAPSASVVSAPDLPAPRFALDADAGLRDWSAGDADIRGGGVAVVADDARGAAFAMNAGSSFGLTAADTRFMFGKESFSLSFAIDAAAPGEIFRIHNAMRATINDAGELRFGITTTEGFASVATTGAGLLDGGWRKVALVFDGAADALRLYLDGTLAAESEALGATKPRESWGLNFGKAWSSDSFVGLLDDIEVRGPALTAAQAAAQAAGTSTGAPAPEPGEEAPSAPAWPTDPDGDATFLWAFGDGTLATGPEARHVYAGHGDYGATLRVTGADGSVDIVNSVVRAPDMQLLALDAAKGLRDVSSYGGELTGSIPIVSNAVAGKAFAMAAGDSFSLALADTDVLFDREAFSLSFSMDASAGGELFRVHNAMRSTIGDDGELRFNITTTEGSFGVRTAGADLLNGGWRDVTLAFDGAGGSLRVYVDGALNVEADAAGATKSKESWGLNFGKAWKSESVVGLFDDVELRADALSPAEVASRHGAPGGILKSAPDPVPAPEERLWTALLRPDENPLETADWIEAADRFSFLLDLTRTAADAPDALLFEKAGDVAMRFTGDDLHVDVARADGGWTRLTAADIGYGDRRVGVAIDEDADVIRLYVDGAEAARKTGVDIAFSDGPSSPIALGGPDVGDIGALIVTNAAYGPEWF
jgi:hypothetical protein